MTFRIKARRPESLDGLIPTTIPPEGWPEMRPYYAKYGYIDLPDLAALLEFMEKYGRVEARAPGPGPFAHPDMWTLDVQNDYD